jgi:hypothetical protein
MKIKNPSDELKGFIDSVINTKMNMFPKKESYIVYYYNERKEYLHKKIDNVENKDKALEKFYDLHLGFTCIDRVCKDIK